MEIKMYFNVFDVNGYLKVIVYGVYWIEKITGIWIFELCIESFNDSSEKDVKIKIFWAIKFWIFQ